MSLKIMGGPSFTISKRRINHRPDEINAGISGRKLRNSDTDLRIPAFLDQKEDIIQTILKGLFKVLLKIKSFV